MRLEINGEIIEMTFSLIEIGMFVFFVYLITFLGVTSAILIARGFT